MNLGETSDQTLESAFDATVSRVESILDRVGDAFPYFADPESGEWTTTPNGNWCGGHWIGLLQLAAEHTGDERFTRAARERTETMIEYMPRESMFCGMNFHYAGFRAYDLTGDRSAFGLGLAGADAMVDYYDERARHIPLGLLDIKGPEQFRGPDEDRGPRGDRVGAVDDVYTALPVLWRAYEETGDPRFRDTAVSHADRHLDWFIKEDGSTWHHAVFDADTGELERQYNELALSDETCWARGQGWNIAGLCRAYTETGAERYRSGLERTVEYYRRRSPDDHVPYWDFEAPRERETPRDTSSAALAAYGLTRLPDQTDTSELRGFGRQILGNLLENHLATDPDHPCYGGLLNGCFNAPGEYATDNELIWSDYYLAYTLYELV